MATPDQATGVSDADITGTVIEAIDSFDAMGLSEPLLRGIYAYGFEKPSRFQFATNDGRNAPCKAHLVIVVLFAVDVCE